jgi:hypothetical protein
VWRFLREESFLISPMTAASRGELAIKIRRLWPLLNSKTGNIAVRAGRRQDKRSTMTSADQVRLARHELEQLLPHYASVDPKDERAAYFRGMMRKTIDSLAAIETLIDSTGPIWTHHCRWIIEAFGYATALNENPKVLDEIKKLGAKTYFLVVEVDDATRKKLLDSISPTGPPSIEVLFKKFEKSVGAETGWMYKVYRLLCEYTHIEFNRLIAYPALGVESPQDLEKRKNVFLNVTVAFALWLPSLAHCPPECGFDDQSFEKVGDLLKKAAEVMQKPT